MKYEIVKIVEAQVENDENKLLTLLDLCKHSRLSETDVLEYINEGIIDFEPTSTKSMRFSYETSERIMKANRLKRDLELNFSGLSLALQLLDKIEDLENRLKRFRY
ncbi:chaperone modulator CbpM [Sediminitomix flava]|uniref:Chaperone modulatory protein CbpM n=1 Tax=Sediminitomix flava TaxID=379075 RepID=A0A315Z7I2_SEDFL|nr:chaperone modulator CbpM [Sediminitomix flava]PWJ38561.1 chaperone modulatory protein CbpM [Sediminitomix flava]